MADPTTDVVREIYAAMRARNPRSDLLSAREEFDAWLADAVAAARADGYRKALEREPARLVVDGVPPGLAAMIERTARADERERLAGQIERGCVDRLGMTASAREVLRDIIRAALAQPADTEDDA